MTRERRRNIEFSLGYGAQRSYNLGQSDLLQQVALGSQIHGRLKEVFLAMNGQEHDVDRQLSLADLTSNIETVELGNIHVEHGNIRAEFLDPCQGSLAISRLRHHLKP